MLSPVSSVNFRGETDIKDVNSLINSPGKYAVAQAGAVQAPEGDIVELSTAAKEEKSHTGAIIGGILGALALTWIGLGIAVHKGKLEKIDAPSGWGEKIKNFAHTIGKSADDAYAKTLGKWFGKSEKAADTGAEAAENAGSETAKS